MHLLSKMSRALRTCNDFMTSSSTTNSSTSIKSTGTTIKLASSIFQTFQSKKGQGLHHRFHRGGRTPLSQSLKRHSPRKRAKSKSLRSPSLKSWRKKIYPLNLKCKSHFQTKNSQKLCLKSKIELVGLSRQKGPQVPTFCIRKR